MDEGQIAYARHDDWLVLKFTGQIRFTMGGAARPTAALDSFLEARCRARDFHRVLIDLTDTESIDSTNLGLLARIAVFTIENYGSKPVMIVPEDDVRRLLENLGFDRIAHLVAEHDAPAVSMRDLPPAGDESAEDRKIILDAHKTLAGLSPENYHTFRDVVRLMESACEPKKPGDDSSQDD